ncbi:uncharacterized protein LOC111032879 isoform X1 [Myzus persicae]|uniref:uncharacterized protein LOC111032879 isoform X1 n=2 Tax=Myzus persicae TaxID=13164 RepID=UPI000B931B36|nr:uncharacterized protein LOC111032879 isoform X1 [Myzus persicae]XP_022169043.1 uncharacterized protein LOC111032879 isoform X1 [Myzus persicae]XP_022169044.1 uncharacterized protein LOC111032879 isoform X1 [Myzus persicae]XP_022169045.1 uncharacterized protein LOC111032879 isoform X1 [Myzus persicae]
MWHEEDDLRGPQPRWPNYHCTRLHHHLHHYENNGIEVNTTGNGFIEVGRNQNNMYYPVSYVMVNDDVQEQEHHHYTFPQLLMSRPPPPPTPAPSSLPPLMLSSPPLPDSYYVHQPLTPMMQQPQQPSLLSSSPESSLTVGCNTIQQRINDYDYSERNSEFATRMIKNDLSSSCFRRLHLGERTVDDSMKSTVIFDKNTKRRTSNNDDKLLEQANEIKTQFEIILDDGKVVDVCKRTLLAAINKVIVDNYESALYKLRKTIRILDVLIFNEGGSGIETVNIDTVGPWLKTLKDIERKITQNQQIQHINGDYSSSQLENSNIIKTEDSFHKRLIQLTSNRIRRNDIINNENNGCKYHFWWKSNLKRYRTTGKVVVEQHRCNINRRQYQRNNKYS